MALQELIADPPTPGMEWVISTLAAELPVTTLTNETTLGGAAKGIEVGSTTGFATSGFILIGEPGSSTNFETVGYTGKTGTTFTGCTGGTKTHKATALISPWTLTMEAAPPAALRPTVPLGQFHILIDTEWIVLESATTATATLQILERAAEGSTAAVHAAGANVVHTLTAGALRNLAITGIPYYISGPAVGVIVSNSNLIIGSNPGATLSTAGAEEHGEDNAALGKGALGALTTGNGNCVLGVAGKVITTGKWNCLVGHGTGALLTTGSENVAFGRGALRKAVTSNLSVALGAWALENATLGENTACGGNALKFVKGAATHNTALGYHAGTEDGEVSTNGEGVNMTLLGWAAQSESSNAIVLGGAIAEARSSMILGGVGSEANFGEGRGVFSIRNAVTNPTNSYAEGGILYVSAGALFYRGSSGTVKELAKA